MSFHRINAKKIRLSRQKREAVIASVENDKRRESEAKAKVPECPHYVFNGCATPFLCRDAARCLAKGD